LFGLGKRFRGKVGGATFSKTDATIEFRYRAPHCRFNPSQPGTSPRHMLSGAIAYQTLQRESPCTIPMVRSVLKNNPWYENRWKEQLDTATRKVGKSGDCFGLFWLCCSYFAV
jgi:hypothetical protein